MEFKVVQNIGVLLDVLKTLKGMQTIFRGVRIENFMLVPSIGRCELLNNVPRAEMESRLFRRFKEQAPPHLDFMPRNEWEWLATAQHHGLSTRLLDWTSNPLVAAYFAVEQPAENNSAIYVCQIKEVVDTAAEGDPFRVRKVKRFRPPAITERIIRQAGLFTIQPDIDQAYVPDDTLKLIIPK